MPLWVRALCALADWLDRRLWGGRLFPYWRFDLLYTRYGVGYALRRDGWRPIRLGEDWPKWLTG